MLAWMVEVKGIEPHVPAWDKRQRSDGTLSSREFEWHEADNEYRCPQRHALRCGQRSFLNACTHIAKANTIIYRSSQRECAACPMKALPEHADAKDRAQLSAAFMSPPVRWRDASPAPRNIGNRGANARKWRFSSPTSSASSNWID